MRREGGRRRRQGLPRNYFLPLRVEALEERAVLAAPVITSLPPPPLGTLVATLNDPSTGPQEFSRAGYSVATDGAYAVVGVPFADLAGRSDVGVVHLYDSTTGAVLRTLNNPTPAQDDNFGIAVAVSGNIVVVGAHLDDTGATNSGAAYVFDGTTGNLLRTLTNPSPANGDQFGAAVAIAGSFVVVGAPDDDLGASGAGLAYVFDASTGNLLRTLNNPTPGDLDSFGNSVAISGNVVAVGAFADKTGFSPFGSAYTFDATTGNLLRTINNPTPQIGDSFGRSVSISGNTLVVGAETNAFPGNGSGSAYIYDAAAGTLLHTLTNPTPENGDKFGYTVSVSGTRVVVGANGASFAAASNTGTAFLFDAVSGSLTQIVNNPLPGSSDGFGFSVAVSGATLVVGAQLDDLGTTDAGSAFIFDAGSGAVRATLSNPTPASQDQFGTSVAVSGSTVVVGSPLEDTGAFAAGSAYLFDAATGALLRTLNNPTPISGERFGWSVAMSGDMVVVGAPDAAFGNAYIYRASTGSLLHTLNNPAPGFSDRFGWSVAIAGTTVVIGAYRNDTGATDAGSAYVFDAQTGTLLRTLSNPTPQSSDEFGSTVAIAGGSIVVGAANDNTGASRSGSAYVFDAATGNLLRTINNPTPAANDEFGAAVAISGNTFVVGSALDDAGQVDSGAAYLFDATSGSLLRTLSNPGPGTSDNFGYSVAMLGNMVVVGARRDTSGGVNGGALHIFDATGALLRTAPHPTPGAGDSFGHSVSVAENFIATGSPFVDASTVDRGAAFVFSTTPPTPENSSYTLTGTFQDTDGADTHTVVIKWGGGGAGQPAEGTTTITTAGPNPAGTTLVSLGGGSWRFTASHPYLDDNPTGTAADDYSIGVTTTDSGSGATTGNVAARVSNVAPTLTVLGATATQENGTTTLSGTIGDVGTQDTFRLVIDWGNGTQSINDVPRGAFSFTRQYLDDNAADSFPITVTLSDDDTASVTVSTQVAVTNVLPASLNVNLVATEVNENGSASLSGSYADPGTLDPHTVTIDWGDGSAPTVLNLAAGVTSIPATAHQYRDDNPTSTPQDSYTISVSVSDDDGGSATTSATVTVKNVAPTLNGLAVRSIAENGTTTLEGTIADAGTLDTYTVVIDWGNGTQTINNLPPGPFSMERKYLDDNATDSYPISVSVTDDDGGAVTANTTIAVVNSPPSVTALAATAIAENGTTILTGTINDVGTLDTFNVVIDWGNGLPTNHVAMQGAFSFTRQYLDDNANDSFPISFLVTDDDDGTVTASTSVTVTNTAPSNVSVNLTATAIDENGSTSLSGSFADAGTLDGHTATIDWGDGSAPTVLNLTAGVLNIPATAHQYLDDPVGLGPPNDYTISVSVADDDGGTMTANASVAVTNVAPSNLSVSLTATAIDEGGNTSLSGSFADAGTLDGHTVTIDWGDGSPNTVLNLGAGVLSIPATAHQYLDDPAGAGPPNDYTIRVDLTDDDGASITGNTTVSVQNLPPTASIESISSPQQEGTAINISGNATDAAGSRDPLSLSWRVFKDGSTVPFATGGNQPTFSFTPDNDGAYILELAATDDDGDTGGISQTINVSNVPPVVGDASLAGVEDAPVPLTLLAMDVPADPLAYSFPSLPPLGALSGAAPNLTYTPQPDFNGVESFIYRVHDGGQFSEATVTITLAPVNDPPSFQVGASPSVADSSGPVSIIPWGTSIASGPANESAQVLHFTIDSNTDPGLFTSPPSVSPSGELTFTPRPNVRGTATLTVSLHDSGGGTDTSISQVFTIEVRKPRPWFNALRPLDVDNNLQVAPLDALMVINYLNAGSPRMVPADAAIGGAPGFLDTNGDNEVAPFDALLVINALNAGLAGEGEPEGEDQMPVSGIGELLALLAEDVAGQGGGKRRRG